MDNQHKDISFIAQVRALTWKNFLLKKRTLKMTITEFIFPIVYCLGYLLYFGVFTTKGSTLNSYFTSIDFYTFVFYLGIVILTFISMVGFTNFQIPRESEINVASSLEMMNVSRFASEVSFIVI